MAQGLRYVNHITRFIIGSATSDSTLTAAFTDNEFAFTTGGFVSLTLYVGYTPAEAGRTFQIQVEGSPDNVTFYPVASVRDNLPFDGTADSADFLKEIVSTGTTQVRRRFTYSVADPFIRVSVKEDSATFGTVNIVQTLSGA